ncbi:hypothetical protein [Myroides sp. TSA_177.3]|uniref:hypothetical protein n=1 Tax=Myroides sp. TSA_177.3 TaxID=3415650 RepID=UPI004045AA77
MSKVISVPKDKEAESALDYNNAKPEQLVELKLTNEEFDILWEEGIFSLINRISGSNIDDFEDEHITDLDVISLVLKELKMCDAHSKDIVKMFELALEYRTSVHFYF